MQQDAEFAGEGRGVLYSGQACCDAPARVVPARRAGDSSWSIFLWRPRHTQSVTTRSRLSVVVKTASVILCVEWTQYCIFTFLFPLQPSGQYTYCDEDSSEMGTHLFNQDSLWENCLRAYLLTRPNQQLTYCTAWYLQVVSGHRCRPASS